MTFNFDPSVRLGDILTMVSVTVMVLGALYRRTRKFVKLPAKVDALAAEFKAFREDAGERLERLERRHAAR